MYNKKEYIVIIIFIIINIVICNILTNILNLENKTIINLFSLFYENISYESFFFIIISLIESILYEYILSNKFKK